MPDKKIEWIEQPSFVLWNRCKAIRKMRKMTRTELSIKSGASIAYLGMIESGVDNGVSEEYKKKIAAALNVPVNAIFPVRVQGMTVIKTGEKLKAAKKK